MNEHFAQMRITEKLSSLVHFTRCKGMAIVCENRIYAYPEEIRGLLGEKTEISAEPIDIPAVVRVSIRGGEVIFIGLPGDFDGRILQFIVEDLRGEIELSSLFDTLCNAGLTISANLSLNTLLHTLMSLCEEIFDNEVSAVMLLDRDKQELYWEVSRGEHSELFDRKMTLPLGQGIAGNVAQTGEAVLVGDVSNDPWWCPSFDLKTGFKTRSLMCVPIKFHGKILGVIEIINKKDGRFTPRDLKVLQALGVQAGGAIESAIIYKELESAYEKLKATAMARERVVDHLSHELGTPLAILSGALSKISKVLESENISTLKETIQRGNRSIHRLLDLRAKIDDIVQGRSVSDEQRLADFIEDALNLVEEVREDERGERDRALLDRIRQKLRSINPVEEIRAEEIRFNLLLHEIYRETQEAMGVRKVEMVEDFEEGLVVRMPVSVLRKVCSGLIKNAIENTPDEGRVEVRARSEKEGTRMEVRDYGIGIHPLDQKVIFSGFFHTQETSHYSTKRPYEFNAGGAGADLLRMKAFSERHRFMIGFESTRCKFIPEDSDLCPGKISECPFVRDRQECLFSGGSLFWISIPGSR
ncbi:MAG: GAF domain-containing protein [Desulfobacterales bacterium]|nr:GAF domain-containing protein [Desulfobacterales bacterium]